MCWILQPNRLGSLRLTSQSMGYFVALPIKMKKNCRPSPTSLPSGRCRASGTRGYCVRWFRPSTCHTLASARHAASSLVAATKRQVSSRGRSHHETAKRRRRRKGSPAGEASNHLGRYSNRRRGVVVLESGDGGCWWEARICSGICWRHLGWMRWAVEEKKLYSTACGTEPWSSISFTLKRFYGFGKVRFR
jgi:hypothetical protein